MIKLMLKFLCRDRFKVKFHTDEGLDLEPKRSLRRTSLPGPEMHYSTDSTHQLYPWLLLVIRSCILRRLKTSHVIIIPGVHSAHRSSTTSEQS